MAVQHFCPTCLCRLSYDPRTTLWKCIVCWFTADFPPPTAPEGIGTGVCIGNSETDCERCGGSWYDHIGFRGHLEGEARLRTSCRIAHCRCEAYVASSIYNPPPNRHQEES